MNKQGRVCPECSKPMMKNGHKWSGRNRVQVWLCPGCGRLSSARKVEPQKK